jgi:plastocyanin
MRNRAGALVITMAMGLLLSSAGLTVSARPRPVVHTVVIEGTRFEPQVLTVRAGDTVVWINKDPFPHTVTAQAGGFDSKSIAPDKSWKYTPGKAGVFPYVCTLHPTMTATLRVE